MLNCWVDCNADDGDGEIHKTTFLVLFVGFHGSGAMPPSELILALRGGHFESPGGLKTCKNARNFWSMHENASECTRIHLDATEYTRIHEDAAGCM